MIINLLVQYHNFPLKMDWIDTSCGIPPVFKAISIDNIEQDGHEPACSLKEYIFFSIYRSMLLTCHTSNFSIYRTMLSTWCFCFPYLVKKRYVVVSKCYNVYLIFSCRSSVCVCVFLSFGRVCFLSLLIICFSKFILFCFVKFNWLVIKIPCIILRGICYLRLYS